MSDKIYNMLVLCTGNSARSIIAEAFINTIGKGRFRAYTAGEVCPVWPGHPITAHWGFEDPATVEGTDEEKRHAFAKVCRQISTRVQLFCALPIDRLDRTAIKRDVDQIGQQPKD